MNLTAMNNTINSSLLRIVVLLFSHIEVHLRLFLAGVVGGCVDVRPAGGQRLEPFGDINIRLKDRAGVQKTRVIVVVAGGN